jgi:hypothetical protein
MPWLAAEQQAAKECRATKSPDCDTEGCEYQQAGLSLQQKLQPVHLSHWTWSNNWLSCEQLAMCKCRLHFDRLAAVQPGPAMRHMGRSCATPCMCGSAAHAICTK